MKSGKFQTRAHEMSHNPNRQTKNIETNLRLYVHGNNKFVLELDSILKISHYVCMYIPKYKIQAISDTDTQPSHLIDVIDFKCSSPEKWETL